MAQTPERKREWAKQWRDDHPGEDKRRWDEWHEKHPGAREASRRKSKLKAKYGLSPEEYDRMFADQGGRCAICDGVGPLFVDHNHATRLVRKLLCRWCNWMLGNAKDRPSVLRAGAKYLENNG